MRWRVIARYRSQLRKMAFILFGKLIAEAFDIHFELASDHVSRSGRIILSIMSCPGIGTPVWQFLVYTELLRHESPILVEPLNFSPSLFRKKQIQSRYYPVLSSAVPRPIHLHLVFNLPQIQMRFPCLAKNGPDAGRASLWHLNKDAF